jgi:PTH1 family peptidyl-tRNA hydrolase
MSALVCQNSKGINVKPDSMKYLIACLGNIGSEYENTRHNIGFKVADHLAKAFEVDFKAETLGDVAQFKHKSRTFFLLKPSTYMNRSGKAVNYWLQKEKIPQENLLVVLDDMNLDFGKQRLRGKGSDGGHNGLKDIDQTIGANYARLRIGIGRDFHKGQQVDFVLGDWSEEEEKDLPDILEYAGNTVKSFGTVGLAFTMNNFNKK